MCFSSLQILLPSLIWSLLVFVHHVPISPHFFISFFVWSFIFLIYQFFWTISHSFCFKKNSSTYSFFPCMRYLFMSFCSYICSSVVSFSSLRYFLVSNHICFPFPSFVSSVHNLSQRQVCGTSCKKTCLSISLFVVHFSYLFVLACLFFSIFCFILMCFWTFFFLSSRSWMFFPLSLPFLCISSPSEDPVWFDHPFSFLFSLLLHNSPCSQEC